MVTLSGLGYNSAYLLLIRLRTDLPNPRGANKVNTFDLPFDAGENGNDSQVSI